MVFLYLNAYAFRIESIAVQHKQLAKLNLTGAWLTSCDKISPLKASYDGDRLLRVPALTVTTHTTTTRKQQRKCDGVILLFFLRGFWYRRRRKLLWFPGRIFRTVGCPRYIKQSDEWVIIIWRKGYSHSPDMEESAAGVNRFQAMKSSHWLCTCVGLLMSSRPCCRALRLRLASINVHRINQLHFNITASALEKRKWETRNQEGVWFASLEKITETWMCVGLIYGVRFFSTSDKFLSFCCPIQAHMFKEFIYNIIIY